MRNMAIVRASYTKSGAGAKAAIRYIEHRPGKDGAKTTRKLFGIDGLMGRWQAYRMVDEAENGSYFYRFAISPDAKTEDTQRDLSLRELTEATMQSLEDRFHQHLHWVAATHADHSPYRHVHVMAVIPGRLQKHDLELLHLTATGAALAQRHQRDLALEQQAQGREEAQWER